MAVKLQQYYIFKFESDVLKEDFDYHINIDLKTARINGEVVSVGDSQMLRSLRKLKGLEVGQSEINDLLIERKKEKKKKSSPETIKRLLELEEKINNVLFVPEIISVIIKNNNHYKHMISNGLYVNNKKYVRFLCSAGGARRKTVLFIQEEFEKPLKIILDNGRNPEVEINPGKYNAYFSLASSATLPVSEPYFTVIKDCEIEREEEVDFVDQNELDAEIITKKKILKFNLFDGMGIISPRLAKQWAEEIGLDYIPSTFIIRNNFIKGMVATIDFHSYSDELGEHFITDLWGNKVNVRDMDLIITQSMFKLWNSYSSLSDYISNCRKNNMVWGITKYAKKKEDAHCFMNYQFLQVLDLSKDQIERICKKTVDYFTEIIHSDPNKTILYLMGKSANQDFDPDIFNKLNDTVTKALILNKNLINDPYVKKYIIRSLNKKIKDSYIGNLILDGFYTMMVNDPYAFMEHMFGLPVKGLLKRNEHYNRVFLDRGKKQLSAMRAPLTWCSEANILNLVEDEKIRKWYQYLDNSAVYNVHGVDHMLHGGSDVDGDIVCLIDSQEIIEGTQAGLPIDYETKKAIKSKIKDGELYKSDLMSFDTKIGYITNCSTTMYAMLPRYDKDSKEYAEIIKRLKYCRFLQGQEIDRVKGLVAREFPRHWIRIDDKIKKKLSEKDFIFQKSLIIRNRPYFMRWLYTNYNREYTEHLDKYDNYCETTFGCSFYDIERNQNTEEKKKVVSNFYYYNQLLDTDCTMNEICHHMENNIKLLKEESKSKINEEIIFILKNHEINFDEEKYKKLEELYRKYKSEKRYFHTLADESGEYLFDTIEQYNKHIRNEAFQISSNISELANLAVDICYVLHPSDNKSFVWNIFGEGIIENIKGNVKGKVFVPFEWNHGTIDYLGKQYALFEIKLEDEYDTFE